LNIRENLSPRLAFEMNFNFLSAVPDCEHPTIHNPFTHAPKKEKTPLANRRTNEVREQNKKEESKIKLN